MHSAFVRTSLVASFCLLPFACDDQDDSSNDQAVIPFNLSEWTAVAEVAEVTEHRGRQALHLVNGAVIHNKAVLTDGVIEFDLAAARDVGFMGTMFRFQDQDNYETFYVRPHHSGEPDANQYMPFWNGHENWQLYYGEEFSARTEYPEDEWFHVRVVVSGSSSEVYIDSDTPSLVIPELKGPWSTGGVGLWAFGTDAWISNVVITPAESPPALSGQSVAREEPPQGVIETWAISERIEEATLSDVLDASTLDALEWTDHGVEYDGILNLARTGSVKDGRNTVLARLTLASDVEQAKLIQLGFSDRARVYVNGRIVWFGSDLMYSRDYRYLGTVGLWDSVYAWLEPGENEVVIAVSEDEGGWGLIGAIPDQSGVTMLP